MKGLARKMDDLGRIVIPVEIRKANGINAGDAMKIKAVEGGILISMLTDRCCVCGATKELVRVGDAYECKSCCAKAVKALEAGK